MDGCDHCAGLFFFLFLGFSHMEAEVFLDHRFMVP